MTERAVKHDYEAGLNWLHNPTPEGSTQEDEWAKAYPIIRAALELARDIQANAKKVVDCDGPE